MTAKEPLRVGVFLDTFEQPRWVARVLSEIQESGIARVVLVVENAAKPPEAGSSALRRIVDRPELLLYWGYSRVDELLFAHRRGRTAPLAAKREQPLENPFDEVDVHNLLEGADHLRVLPKMTRFSDYFESSDVTTLRAHHLDVVVRFGFRILRGDVLETARYGVWSYHHGDNRRYRGGPAGFWEVFERSPVTGSVLQILTEDLDNGVVIYRSFAGTDPYSVARNRANYFWTASAFVQRRLRDLHRDGDAVLAGPRERVRELNVYSDRLYTRPSNQEMIVLLGRHGARVARDRLHQRLRPAKWVLAYCMGSVPTSLYRFRYRVPPSDRFWADPFPIEWDDRRFVFFEDYVYANGRAHISMMEVGGDGSWSDPIQVMDPGYHVSYPFMFEWQGELLMIPETVDQRRVELWRCVRFPDRWERDRVLLDGVRAVDATLAEIDEQWCMFVNIAVEGSRDFEELHLFTAADPRGPWLPHRCNPVKSDVRSSRPAGRLFQWNGTWHRPAQDGSGRYGRAVAINRIRHMDSSRFEEDVVARIEPRWDRRVIATHTFNMVPGLTVVDALMRSPGTPTSSPTPVLR